MFFGLKQLRFFWTVKFRVVFREVSDKKKFTLFFYSTLNPLTDYILLYNQFFNFFRISYQQLVFESPLSGIPRPSNTHQVILTGIELTQLQARSTTLCPAFGYFCFSTIFK